MENYDRFVEIQSAAMNSEDAGVLQYSKTLDSLETKLNQISNSFQQFYMSIANGPVVGGFLEILNNVITNLSSYDPVTAIAKVLSLISSLKNVIQLIFTTITAGASATMTQIKENQNAIFGSAPGWAESLGRKIAQGIQKGLAESSEQNRAAVEGAVQAPATRGWKANLARGLTAGGTAAQMIGLGISQNTMGGYWTSNTLQIAGGVATTLGQAVTNPLAAVITGITTITTLVQAIANADEKRLENLKTQTEEANVERVQAKKDASDLQSYIDKEQRLRKARYDSAEAAQEYTDIQNEIAEKYPEYISYIDESGNAIVNMTTASKDLAAALATAGEKAEDWAKRQIQLNTESYQAAENKIRGRGYRKSQEELNEFDIDRYYNTEYSEAGSWIPKEALEQAFVAGGDFKTEEDRLKAAAAVVGAEGSSLADIISVLNARVAEGADNDLTASMEYWVQDFLGEVLTFDNKTKTYTVSENYKNYLEAKKVLDATDATTRPVLTSTYSSQYLNAEANKTNANILNRFSGEEAILAQMSRIRKENVSEYTSEDYQVIADEFANFLSSFSSNDDRVMQRFLDDLSAQSWNDISEFIDRKGAEPGSDIYNAFSQAYEAQASVAKENLTKQLGEAGYGKDIPTLLNTLSVNQMEDYTEVLADIFSRKDKDGNYTSEYAEQASKQQIKLLEIIYGNIGKIPADLLEKLMTDFGSSDWYKSFTEEDWQQIAKFGDYEDINAAKQAFQNGVYQSLSTSISNASDRVSELAEEYANASEKNYDSGFDLTAAKELIQKFGLDLDKFAEYFVYDKLQGKYKLTEKALAETRNKATYDADENISENADLLKGLTSKEAVESAISGYDLQEADALQTALNNSLDNEGNLDTDLWQKNIDDLVESGKLSREHAANLLISAEVQGIINSQKDFQDRLEPSLETLGNEYVTADGKLNEDLLKETGLFYDTATGSLIAGLKYYENIANDETLDANQRNYVSEKIAELKEQQTNLGYEFIGKITANQIQLLRQLYGDKAVADLAVGQTWTGNEAIFGGQPDLKANRQAGADAKLKNATDTLISAITNIATGVEVDAQELANAFVDTGLEVSVGELADILSGKDGDPLEVIQAKYQTALENAGISGEEFNKRLSELSIRIVEAIADAIDGGISLLAKGITEGLGTEDLASLRNLAKAQGIEEQTFNSYYTMNGRTGRAQFTDSGALDLASALTEKYGSRSSAMKELAEAFQGRGGILNSYDTIDKEIKRIESSTEKWTDAEKKHLKQLKEIRQIYGEIADSQRYDFMNFDAFNGHADNFDNWISSISTFKDVISDALESGGQMNYKSFMAFMDYIQKFHPNAEGLTIAGQSLDAFTQAVLNTVDIAGNVDLSAVATNLEGGISDIAGAMQDTLKTIAEERIKSLKATREALLAQQAVQEALKDAKIDLGSFIVYDEKTGDLNYEQTIKKLQAQQDAYIDFIKNSDYSDELKQYMANEGSPYQMALKALNIEDFSVLKTEQQLSGLQQLFQMMPDLYNKAADSIDPETAFSDTTSYLEAFTAKMMELIQEEATKLNISTAELKTDEPQPDPAKEANKKAQEATEKTTKIIQEQNDVLAENANSWGNVAESAQDAMAETQEAVTAATEKVEKLTDLLDGGSPVRDKEVVAAEYSFPEPSTRLGPPKAQTWDERLAATQTTQNQPAVAVASKAVAEAVVTETEKVLADVLSEEQMAAAKLEAQRRANIAANGKTSPSLSNWAVQNVALPGTQQKPTVAGALSSIAAKDNVAYWAAQQQAIQANDEKVQQLNANIQAAKAAEQEATSSATADLTEVQEEINNTESELNSLTDHTRTVSIDANARPAIATANNVVKQISSMEAAIQIKADYQNVNGYSNNPSMGGGNPRLSTWEPGTGRAHARGTLVGELGPELAVYDDAYHLLGRDGAQLVSLPDDAIIFNHKQTEGILKGMPGGRGHTVNGGPAFVNGGTTGPARAGGIGAAIAAIDKEISIWQAIASLTTADLLNKAGGGGGGSGETLKAHIEDLVEWYNLSRQIADIEQKINNIIAKRENLTDGREYLKSLREQQHLLEGQAIVQQTLLGYQQKQLELQAEQINTNDIWKQFFHVDETGLLQYNMGNEVNGGKGTLTLLQQLNQMSGTEQLAFIKNLGYSYTDNDGNVLDGEDLISKFFEEAQAQIDKYDELRDTVESTDEALEKLQTSINEIEQEIRENQKQLEETIYNTIVEAWEKQISQLQEQTDMLREANENYVNGLSDALNKERNLYNQNESIADRQQLQRQLSLLRRSGGSASQIASLEEQLNSALKEEYFSHQQDTIDSIKDANEKQLDAMNKQIMLQQEALDFQKENGVIWTKVYEILAQSDGKIMQFLIENSSDFIQSSALAQADTLNEEWAKRIGIYKANSEMGYEPYVNQANRAFALEAWNSTEGANKQSMFDKLDIASQKALQDYFASAFANEMLRNGGDEAGAYDVAREDMYKKLYMAYNQMMNIQNTTLDDARNNSQPGTSGGSGSGSGGSGGGGDGGSSSSTSYITLTITAGNNGGYPSFSGGSLGTKVKRGSSVSISPNPKTGYKFSYLTYGGKKITGASITANAPGKIYVYYVQLKSSGGSGKNSQMMLYAASGALVSRDNQPALLHKGEGVFTASETSALRNLVQNYQTLAAQATGRSLLSSANGFKGFSMGGFGGNSELNINPGAVVINVDKLDDKYDVDELATDVFNKLSSIAAKATNRGVSRR